MIHLQSRAIWKLWESNVFSEVNSMGFFFILKRGFDSQPILFCCCCEEDWPWANTCCQSSSFCWRNIVPELTSVPIFLYFVCGSLQQLGCQVVHIYAWDVNVQTQAAEAEHARLKHYTMGPTQCLSFLFCMSYLHAIFNNRFNQSLGFFEGRI